LWLDAYRLAGIGDFGGDGSCFCLCICTGFCDDFHDLRAGG
jgi:hypothetical protein